ARIRSTLITFDRYFHDTALDPKRYRLPDRFAFARHAAAWVPAPDLWLVLTAPAEVLLARKAEVPLATARELVAHYEGVADWLKGVVMIQATQPADAVQSQALSAALHVLQRRTELQLQVQVQAQE
ncbi:MAG: hypothetical protein OEU93_17290, partial [Rubrivivax sp.]|nr:hypothetical protein [Rubrivivax sp.]